MSIETKRRYIIKEHENRLTPLENFKVGKEFEISRILIKRTIDRYNESSSIKDIPRPRCPLTSKTQNPIKQVREKSGVTYEGQ